MTFRILNSEARGQIAAHLFGGPSDTHPRAGSVSGTDVITTPGVEPPPYDTRGGHSYGTGGEGGYTGGGGGGPPIRTFSRIQGGGGDGCTGAVAPQQSSGSLWAIVNDPLFLQVGAPGALSVLMNNRAK